MFEGFASKFVDTGDASIFTRYGGEGPAVLLLHGHPRTSATWHWVAPLDRAANGVQPDRATAAPVEADQREDKTPGEGCVTRAHRPSPARFR